MSMKRRKVSNFIINPHYQWKYILGLLLSGGIMVVLLLGISYAYIRENYDILVDLSPMTEQTKALLYQELAKLVRILVVTAAFFLGLVFLAGVYFSHKAAGPLHNFKRVFADIKAGRKDTRVHLRPGDEFQEIAQEFNSMMDQLTGPSKG